ncbi:MAG TPA: helix-turn-helix domain-containing protein [Noviherbaspirillum sp.]|uniref:helix-turn-helix domain-containing protein n=1 Tax=Noviherbaspirillum sp. TaxID=1926288 RepID=UPI002B4A3013|nr:helix-turn-helix domain-containing protein [Noviherbaspirillum sp.]HJV86930.1 helix-turn-helix domain-containing protein [Noviherbaspirillum sp.]
MNTAEYLDALRAKLDLPSDYALQKVLGVTKQQVSRYRKGHDVFSDEVALRVAEFLGRHPGLVMLDMHRERAKTPESKALWQEIFKGFLLLLPRADWGMVR